MKQNGNTSLFLSIIIIIVVVGFIVYFSINKNKNVTSESSNTNLSEENRKLEESENSETRKNGNIENQNTTPKEEEAKNMNTENILKDFSPVSSVNSLQKIDLIVGTGEEVKPGSTVSVHYTGAVAKTGIIFQSSKDFGDKPVSFPLGSVIKGWQDGIPGMKIGGVRRLIIPSEMAYGATPPIGSGIPVNADLVFDVELIGFE